MNQKSPVFQTEIKFEVGRNFISLTQMELQEKGYIVVVLVNSNITNYSGSRRRERFLEDLEDRLGSKTSEQKIKSVRVRTGGAQSHTHASLSLRGNSNSYLADAQTRNLANGENQAGALEERARGLTAQATTLKEL